MIGIYRILNTKTGRAYIGSSIDIEIRWRCHRADLTTKIHIDKYLQRAWEKYGPESFVFEVIGECESDILREREQVWIDQTDLKYNLAERADSPPSWLGKKRSSESSKLRWENRRRNGTANVIPVLSEDSRYRKGESSRRRAGKTYEELYGPERAAELRSMQSRMRRGSTRRPHSGETREKQRQAALKREARKRNLV